MCRWRFLVLCQMWFAWKLAKSVIRDIAQSAPVSALCTLLSALCSLHSPLSLSVSKNANQIGKMHPKTKLKLNFCYSCARVWHKLPFKIIRKVAAIFDTVTNLHCQRHTRLCVWVSVCGNNRVAAVNVACGKCNANCEANCQNLPPTPSLSSHLPRPLPLVYLACCMQALNIDLKNMQLWIVCSVSQCRLGKSNRNWAAISKELSGPAPHPSSLLPLLAPNLPQSLNQLPLVASLWPILNLI